MATCTSSKSIQFLSQRHSIKCRHHSLTHTCTPMHTQAASNGDKTNAYIQHVSVCAWLFCFITSLLFFPLSICLFDFCVFFLFTFVDFSSQRSACVCVYFFWCYFTACLESIRHVISRRHIVETFLSPTNEIYDRSLNENMRKKKNRRAVDREVREHFSGIFRSISIRLSFLLLFLSSLHLSFSLARSLSVT